MSTPGRRIRSGFAFVIYEPLPEGDEQMKWLLLFPWLLMAADLARPRIPGVAHIAIFASDFEKSKAFYRDFLGFEERI